MTFDSDRIVGISAMVVSVFFTVPGDDIKRVRSLMTVVGGKVVHTAI